MTHSFVPVVPGNLIHAQDLNQVINALDGLAAAGVPIVLTALSDPSNFALVVQNQESSNSRALLVLKSDGTQLVRVDVNGVTLGAPLNLAAQSVNGTALLNASVPNAALGPDVARANLLTNGGFEIWQRGNGPVTGGNQYTADRWAIGLGASSTISVSRDTTNMDSGSGACAAVTYTHSATSQIYQGMRLGAGAEWQAARGRQLSLSIRVRTSIANAVSPMLWYDGTGGTTTLGTAQTGSGTYQTLTVTATIPVDATFINVGVQLSASCTAYLDNACLVVGSQPANYVPLHPADDLARCLRYYETFGQRGAGDVVFAGYSAGPTTTYITAYWKAEKPVTPSVTIVPTWVVSLLTSFAINSSSGYSSSIAFTTSAAGSWYAVNSNAGNTITVEANP